MSPLEPPSAQTRVASAFRLTFATFCLVLGVFCVASGWWVAEMIGLILLVPVPALIHDGTLLRLRAIGQYQSEQEGGGGGGTDWKRDG